MAASRLAAAAPYAVLLAAAAFLFVVAGEAGGGRPGQLGPMFWPRMAIILMALMCAIEIARIVRARGRGEAHGIADLAEAGGEAESADAPRQPRLLAGGVALTLAYGVLIPLLGFPLTTFAYAVAFMYLGGYRSHPVIWLSAFLGSLLLSVLFLKVVYVSLPRGVPPFDQATDLIVGLF